jgi:hypothetical protein
VSDKKNLIHEIVQNYREVGSEIGKSPKLSRYLNHPRCRFTMKQVLDNFKSEMGLMNAAGLITPTPKKYEDPIKEPIIRVIDLELLPMVLLGYGIYDQNFSVNQILEDTSLASFAYSDVGSDEIHYHEVNWKKNPREDRALAKKLLEVMSEADIILGQNSDRFDVRVANEKFFRYELGQARPVKYLDTKKMGKRNFYFPSYSLEYMSDRYCETKKLTNRKFPGIQLQRACLEKNPEAWEEMRIYNIIDVKSTKELAIKMAPWGSPNLNSMRPGALFRCDNILCGSTNIIHRGHAKGTGGGRFKQYSCKDCGHWFSESGAANNLLSPNKKASLRGPL